MFASLVVAFIAHLSSASLQPDPMADSSMRINDEEKGRVAHEAVAQGRPWEAFRNLETLVAPRHHTLPVRSEWHFDLGQVYSKFGFIDAAQGQFRMAIATGEAEASAAQEALDGLIEKATEADIVPDVLGFNGAKYYSLAWVDRGDGQLDFASVFVLPEETASQAAYMAGVYRADCSKMESRMLQGGEYDSRGEKLRDFDKTEFTAPPNALSRHALAMVCDREPDMKQRRVPKLGPVDKLIGPEAGGGDMYEAEIAC